MRFEWHDDGTTGVLDAVTDYRLSRDPSTYPRPIEEIWWSAIFHLQDTSLNAFQEEAERLHPGCLLVPDVYDPDECADRPAVQSVSLIARTALIRAANTVGNPFGCSGVYLGSVVPEAHLPLDVPAQERGWREDDPIVCHDRTVVTAVIDDAIGFANALFRDGERSSRVHLAYIMSTPVRGTHQGEGRWESQGRSLDKQAIDRLLADNTENGVTDEEALYVQAGAIDFADGGFSPLALRRSHGTHVAGLAAGHPIPNAPEHRPILFASLPWRVTEDTSGYNLYPSLLLALRRLEKEGSRFRRADGSVVPMVFNFSYGTLDGPHDGSGLIPELIQRAVNRRKGALRRMVLPAGNTNLSRTHAKASLEPGGSVTLDLKVMADDRTDSHVEMWLPPEYQAAGAPVHVTVTAPGGATATIVAGDRRVHRLRNRDGQIVARLSDNPENAVVDRSAVILSINRTFSVDSEAVLAPIGDWKIEIRRPSGGQKRVDVQVWIRRDDTLPGFAPRGRQSHFNNPDYQKFNAYGAPLPVDPKDTSCPVRRAGTLNGLATGESPLVVASYTHSNSLISDYSASGPVPSRDGPDAAALGDHSPVLRGVLSAGSKSGYLVRQSGTSVAAPRIARLVVDEIAKGKEKKRKKVGDRSWLQTYAENMDPKDFPQPRPEFARGGAGRVRVAIDLGTVDHE